MILHVTKIIKRFRNKQKERIKKRNQCATRGNNKEIFDERMSEKFVIAMDNLFYSTKGYEIFERHRNWSCWDIAIQIWMAHGSSQGIPQERQPQRY